MATSTGLLLVNIKTPTERFSKNGEQKNLHLVVKKTTFTVVITPYPPLDSHRLAIDASLLYDCPDLKPVDYVRKSPLEYVAHTDSTGAHFIVEMKILVLTSQLEDMFFRIKFEAYDTLLPREQSACLVAISEPLKVLSKADQIQKKRRGSTSSCSGPESKKKKLVNKGVVDSLVKILNQQNQQTLLVRNLFEKEMLQQNTLCSEPFPLPLPSSLPLPLEKTFPDEKAEEEDFEEAFRTLMRAYDSLPTDQRPATIKKVIRNSTTTDRDIVFDMMTKFQTEENLIANDGKCVHQLELETVELYLKSIPCFNDLTCI